MVSELCIGLAWLTELMKTTHPLQKATSQIKHLAAAFWWSQAYSNQSALGATDAQSQQLERYASTVFQSVAVFRLVSFSLGAGLVFALNPTGQPTAVIGMVVLLVGLYNVYRIMWRLDPTGRATPTQWLSLGVDLWLSVALIILSGGLDSPFLIYSLSPILTASLLMDIKTAVMVAAVSAASVSGVHAAGGLWASELPWVLSGNYLVLSLLYWAVCFLIVSLPFLANLNWQLRVRSESLATERQRLRREVHDNVAQTLAFLSLKMQRAEQRAAEGRTAITERDVAEIGSVVERAYLAVRDYLDGADEEGEGSLAANLTSVTDQWSRDTGTPAELSAAGAEGELPANTKFQLLQVTREALANVAKHAYPKHVWVDMECSPEKVTIRVRDDGRGFSTEGIRGHGMGIMSERTAMAGAKLDISSALGEGTQVVVSFTRELAPEHVEGAR